MDYFSLPLPDVPSDVGAGGNDVKDPDGVTTGMDVEADHMQIPVATPATETPSSRNIALVSTAFYPGANVDPSPCDSVIISSDKVYFHVHRWRLLSVSNNAFNNLDLTMEAELDVPEHSALLNVVLHTIYGMSCSKYSPSLDLLLSSLSVLKKYGVALGSFMTPATPLFDMILTHAPLPTNAIEIYMVAAEHDLFTLAQAVSFYLLSFQLPTLTDEMALRMGSIYLKRLFDLHMDRSRTLLQLAVAPPKEHTPTAQCSLDHQKKLTRAWSFACASLVWDARPDSFPDILHFVLCYLGSDLSCDLCKKSLNERIKEFILGWTATPV